MRRAEGGRAIAVIAWLLASAALSPIEASAWGAEAHRIICEIAWQRSTPDVRNWITSVRSADTAPSSTFAESCTWADQVRDTTQRETAGYHYINVPPGAGSIDLQRDCSTKARCVPWAVHYYSAALQNKRLPRPARAEALKFVAHFVGDLHQPMHVAHAADRGGNTVFVDFFGEYGSCRRAREGRAFSLHHVWDDAIVQRAGWRWRVDGPRMARAISDTKAHAWSSSTAIEWGNESLKLCEEYACRIESEVEHCSGMRFKKIEPSYFDRARQDTEVQLQKAGVRLAQMLEKAAARDR